MLTIEVRCCRVTVEEQSRWLSRMKRNSSRGSDGKLRVVPRRDGPAASAEPAHRRGDALRRRADQRPAPRSVRHARGGYTTLHQASTSQHLNTLKTIFGQIEI